MPNYPSPPQNFKELIQPFPAHIQSVARELRRIIMANLPQSEEQVSGGKKIGNALYSIGDETSVICGIQPAENFCRLFFHGWRELKASGFELSGSGKNARHIKIYSLIECDEEKLSSMIDIARRSVMAK